MGQSENTLFPFQDCTGIEHSETNNYCEVQTSIDTVASVALMIMRIFGVCMVHAHTTPVLFTWLT